MITSPLSAGPRDLLTHQAVRDSFTQAAEATDLGVQGLESQPCQLILRASLELDEVLVGEAEAALCKQGDLSSASRAGLCERTCGRAQNTREGLKMSL